MFDHYHSSLLEFIAIVPSLSTFTLGFILVLKIFSTISALSVLFFSPLKWVAYKKGAINSEV